MKREFIFLYALGVLSLGTLNAEELIETQSALYREATKYSLAEERRVVFQRAIDDLGMNVKEAFWKIYADYEKEKKVLDETRLRLPDQYVSNATLMSDDQLAKIVSEAIANQDKELALRKTYFKRFRSGVSGTAAARFYQTDDLLTAVIKVGVLSKLPVFRSSILNNKSENQNNSIIKGKGV